MLAGPAGRAVTAFRVRASATRQIGAQTREAGSGCVAPLASGYQTGLRAAYETGLDVRRAGKERGTPARPGAALAEERLLGVVGAKLRAKMLPGGCAPEFDIAVARPEGFAAEHAAAGAAVHEIPAAGQHRNLSIISAVLAARSCPPIR